MLRKIEVDGYEILITASEVLSPLPSSTAIEGYRVTAVISRRTAAVSLVISSATLLLRQTCIWRSTRRSIMASVRPAQESQAVLLA